jgi:hypothetical protein
MLQNCNVFCLMIKSKDTVAAIMLNIVQKRYFTNRYK